MFYMDMKTIIIIGVTVVGFLWLFGKFGNGGGGQRGGGSAPSAPTPPPATPTANPF